MRRGDVAVVGAPEGWRRNLRMERKHRIAGASRPPRRYLHRPRERGGAPIPSATDQRLVRFDVGRSLGPLSPPVTEFSRPGPVTRRSGSGGAPIASDRWLSFAE